MQTSSSSPSATSNSSQDNVVAGESGPDKLTKESDAKLSTKKHAALAQNNMHYDQKEEETSTSENTSPSVTSGPTRGDHGSLSGDGEVMKGEDGGSFLLQAKETSHRVQSEITETERSLKNIVSPAPNERTPNECSVRNSYESKDKCLSCANYAEKNVFLRHELRRMEKEIRLVRAQMIVQEKKLNLEKEMKEKVQDDLQKELQISEKRCLVEKQEKAAMQDKIDMLLEKISNSKHEQNEAGYLMREQLEEENMSFQKKTDELQKKNDIISKKATELEKKNKELQAALEVVRTDLATVSNERDATKIELVTVKNKLDAVEGEMTTVKTERDAVRVDLAKIEAKWEVSKDQLATTKDELATVKGERDVAIRKLATAEAQLDAGIRELATVKPERDAATVQLVTVKYQLATVKGELDVRVRELVTVKNERDQAKAELSMVKTERDTTKVEMVIAKREVALVRAERDAAIVRREEQEAAATARYNDLTTYCSEMQQRLARYRQQQQNENTLLGTLRRSLGNIYMVRGLLYYIRQLRG